MTDWKTRLIPLFLVLACCGIVGMTYTNVFADGHRDDDEHEHEEDEHWEDDEEWEEEWHMEEAMFEIEMMRMHFELFAGLFDMVRDTHEVTSDAELTAIMAVTGVEDLIHEPEDRAEFLEGELEHVENAAVRRTIRGMLAETYAELEDTESATKHLSVLIRGGN